MANGNACLYISGYVGLIDGVNVKRCFALRYLMRIYFYIILILSIFAIWIKMALCHFRSAACLYAALLRQYSEFY